MMRNLLLLTVFLLALAPAVSVHAQDADGNANPVVEHDKDSDGFKARINIGGDDEPELSVDEKFDKAKKAINDVVGEEFTKDLELGLEGLDDEQKEQLISAFSKDGLQINTGGDDIPAGAVFIAVTAIVLVFGMPVFIVLLVLWFGHQKRRQKMDVIRSYVDSDKDVPLHLVSAFAADNEQGSLRKGILLTGVGLGVFLGLGMFGGSDVGGLGLIPLFMGLARLVYWYFAERTSNPLSQ